MKFLITLVSLLFVLHSPAQQAKNFTVSADDVSEKALFNTTYLYPAFNAGQVYFKDGTSASAKLNYNLLLDEIKFIDAKGDTLGLANETTLNYLAIKSDTFFYNKGYIRQIARNAQVRLLLQQKIKEVGKEKIGSYGQASSATSNTNYTRISGADGHTATLSPAENIIFSRQIR